MSRRIGVLASGGGTNLQAVIDHFRGSDLAQVALVVSDRAGAGALERARREGIGVHTIPVQGRPIAAVTADTLDALERAGVDVLLLAGYLRLVPTDVVKRYAFRLLNIHPALLPAFGGKGMFGRRVHEAVLQSGARITGPTVHFVNERFDEGRILAQWPVPVLDGDTPETLAARVLQVEHVLYPAAVEWLVRILEAAEGREAADRALASGPPLLPGQDVAFGLREGGGPDPTGIRRLFGLD